MSHVDEQRTDGTIPPHDLHAEAAILSSILFPIDAQNQSHVLADIVPLLQPQHMYSDAHRRIYSAVLELRASGRPVDAITVRSYLADAGRLEQIGGEQYLDDLMLKVPATAYPVEHAKIIVAKARVRAMITTAQGIAAQGYSVNGESAAYLERALRSVAEAAKDDSASSAFRLLGGKAILDQLVPIKWVSPDLCLGPGRPTLVAGYGYSLKTFALQALAVAVATGRPIWGEFRCVQGKVLHLDYEQGEYATRMRYQRLAFGLGINPGELSETLSLACFPGAYLTTPGIEDTLVRLCEGFTVCIIDSFRAATPGVDENDSGVRIYLDILTRVSERTGCSFLVIHHAGKDQPDRDSRQVARGSSAIFDACGTVLKLQGKKAFEPVKVDLVKTSAAAVGKVQQVSFYLDAADISDDTGSNTKAGIRIEHRTEDQIERPEAPAIRASILRKAIEGVLRSHAEGLSRNDVAALLRRGGTRCSNVDVGDALSCGGAEGWCRERKRDGRGGGKAWFLSRSAVEEASDDA